MPKRSYSSDRDVGQRDYDDRDRDYRSDRRRYTDRSYERKTSYYDDDRMSGRRSYSDYREPERRSYGDRDSYRSRTSYGDRSRGGYGGSSRGRGYGYGGSRGTYISGARRRYSDNPGDKDHPPKMHTIIKGEVSGLQTFGAFVKVPGHKKEGLLHTSQISNSRVEDPAEVLRVGDVVYCKVISVEDRGEKYDLSMKVVHQSSGKDLDPENIEPGLDQQRRKAGWRGNRQRMDQGSSYGVTCRRCGGKGHMSRDCREKSYNGASDREDDDRSPRRDDSPRRSKKLKSDRKDKDRHHSDDDDSYESDHSTSQKERSKDWKKSHHSDEDSYDSDDSAKQKRKQ